MFYMPSDFDWLYEEPILTAFELAYYDLTNNVAPWLIEDEMQGYCNFEMYEEAEGCKRALNLYRLIYE